MRRLVGRVRTQRGLAMSSPVALLSVGAVVLAGAAFVATSGHAVSYTHLTLPTNREV